MNRFGWSVLGVILLLVAGFVASLGRVDEAPLAGVRPSLVPQPQAIASQGPEITAPLVLPVVGIKPAKLVDTWGQSRGGGTRVHQAIDIIAPGGTPVVAAMAGRVEKLFTSNAGGLTVYVRSADARTMAYYAHLADYAPGLAEGQVLTVGAPIGTVGDTGNAGAGNTHLHFALAAVAPGDKWYQGTPVNPYPLLAHAAPAR